MRAARPRLAGRHGGADAVLARLVGRRGDHAAAADAADDDRLAAQRGLVALLDRREEGVQVQVEDRGVGAHGGNVPPGTDRTVPVNVHCVVHSRAATAPRPQGARDGAGPSAPLGSVDPMTSPASPAPRATSSPPARPRTSWPPCPSCSASSRATRSSMLTFGGVETFHARVDLPPPTEADEAVELLLEPALQHRVTRVVFVVYADDGPAARAVAAPAASRLRRGRHRRGRGAPRPRRALVRARPARGARGRGALRRRRPPVPRPGGGRRDRRARLARRARGGAAPSPDGGRRGGARRAPGGCPSPPGEIADLVDVRLEAGRFTPVELARVLLGLLDAEGRDAAWAAMSRDVAARHVRLWTDAVQRAPDDLVAAPAAVLGAGRVAGRPRRAGLVRRRPVPRPSTRTTRWRRLVADDARPTRCRRRRGRRRGRMTRAARIAVGTARPWRPAPSASRRSCWSSTRPRAP